MRHHRLDPTAYAAAAASIIGDVAMSDSFGDLDGAGQTAVLRVALDAFDRALRTQGVTVYERSDEQRLDA